MAEFTKDGLLRRIKQSILEEFENKNGHTIQRHINVELNSLKNRCLSARMFATSFHGNDSDKYIMSTLTDEIYMGGTINYILAWLNDGFWEEDLIIEMEYSENTGYGYQYNRITRDADYIVCNAVRIVLRKLDHYEFIPFLIVTAYPCILK